MDSTMDGVTSSMKLSETVSSPTALNAGVYNVPTDSGMQTTPRLSQIGKQSSVNFRHSQLYDSGAESCDTDEQTRLIRTPSSRSHKFIIIPAGAATAGVMSTTTPTAPVFRQTISNASLASMAAALQQKLPLLSSVTTTQPQHQQYQQQQQPQPQRIIPRQLSTTSAATLATTKTTPHNSKSHPQSSSNLNDHVIHPHPQAPALMADSSGASTINSLRPSSDVIHQLDTATASTSAAAAAAATAAAVNAAAASVTFTIDDCESDNGHAPYTAAELNPANHNFAVASIDTATHLTPATATAPSTLAGTSYAGIPTLRIGLKPRNSSMRSIVSAYMPGSHELYTDPQYSFPQSLTPNTTVGKELSASSYIYRDHGSSQIFSDVTSVRSLASIGIGSTDGRKLVIRHVPRTPTELFSIVHPPSPAPRGIDDDDDDSFMDMSDETAYLKPRRQHWGNKMQFVLACIGYSVGLGNVWRFPYMCYKSGGGVFLVPYCIILFVCSIPLLFMELSVGQYTGRGPIGALGQLCPLFKGAGVASVVVSFLMSTYYSVIIGYSIYYFFTSFKPYMPWIDCNNRWNTPDCWVPQRVTRNTSTPEHSRTPSEEFFENKVLQISPGIEFPGLMRWELFACLICAWLMVYFATWKSIKSSAKVRYFTATFPFVLIIILTFRAVTLDGADEGLRYFFRPNWSELKNANVWINAASQNFNSLGITFGTMISFASYNKYNNNILRDTISVSVVNILTSLLVGIFAFATLGNLALEQNTNVKDVIGDGPGMIFVVYPQAMAKMPYAQLWAVMFFFMLLCLGLNSQFAIVEVVVTSIQDGFPNWIKRHLGYHEIVVLFVCVISFLFGLPNLIQGGIYYFQLMDHYAASVSIMFLAFCQMIAIAWFYGTGRLSKNIKQMTGKAPSLYIKSSWVLLGPCLLFAIWILSLVNYQEPSYHNGRYKYPEWAYGIGWMFTSLSLICIPGFAVINIIRSTGRTFWERVLNTLRPHIYECRICGEHHCEHDFSEQEQYLYSQEMSGMYKPIDQMKASAPSMPINLSQRNNYSPINMQEQQQQQQHRQQQQQQQDRIIQEIAVESQQHSEMTPLKTETTATPPTTTITTNTDTFTTAEESTPNDIETSKS